MKYFVISAIVGFMVAPLLGGCESEQSASQREVIVLTDDAVVHFIATMVALSDQQAAFDTIGDSQDLPISDTDGAFANLLRSLSSDQADILRKIVADQGFSSLADWVRTGDRVVIAVLLVNGEVSADALEAKFSDRELATIRQNIPVLMRQLGMSE